jgi:hypothetical protein
LDGVQCDSILLDRGQPMLRRSTVGDTSCHEKLEPSRGTTSPRHRGRPEGNPSRNKSSSPRRSYLRSRASSRRRQRRQRRDPALAIRADLGAPATSSRRKAELRHRPTTLGYYYYCRASTQPLTAGIVGGSGLRSAGSPWRLSGYCREERESVEGGKAESS